MKRLAQVKEHISLLPASTVQIPLTLNWKSWEHETEYTIQAKMTTHKMIYCLITQLQVSSSSKNLKNCIQLIREIRKGKMRNRKKSSTQNN